MLDFLLLFVKTILILIKKKLKINCMVLFLNIKISFKRVLLIAGELGRYKGERVTIGYEQSENK